MVSLMRWLKTGFFAVIFFIIGMVLFVGGGAFVESNSFMGIALLILGIIGIATAVYFWKNPGGTFR